MSARGEEGGREGEGKEGETRCGTHSLSMGHSHSLGREGNSAAVLNPANWRNSTTEPPPPLHPPISPCAPCRSPAPCRCPCLYSPPTSRRTFGGGPSLSHSRLVARERRITRRSSIYGCQIDFCNGDFTERAPRSKIHAPRRCLKDTQRRAIIRRGTWEGVLLHACAHVGLNSLRALRVSIAPR